ncbi:hypothetical protein L3i22_093520 [Actinoplanes sp. L3-i22]|nr:hypothetical protein L3i22_093520 [Actinoplanes sp. L3-i22]
MTARNACRKQATWTTALVECGSPPAAAKPAKAKPAKAKPAKAKPAKAKPAKAKLAERRGKRKAEGAER